MCWHWIATGIMQYSIVSLIFRWMGGFPRGRWDLWFSFWWYWQLPFHCHVAFLDAFSTHKQQLDFDDMVDTLICSVNCNKVTTKEPDFEALCPCFAWAPAGIVKRTFEATTQYAQNTYNLPFCVGKPPTQYNYCSIYLFNVPKIKTIRLQFCSFLSDLLNNQPMKLQYSTTSYHFLTVSFLHQNLHVQSSIWT